MSDDNDPLLEVYLEQWLQRRRTQVRPTTHDGYRHAVRNHLRPRLGALRLSELDRRQIERAYRQFLEVGGARGPLAPRSVQRLHAILHRALADAQLDGLLQDNPAEHARTPSPHAGATEIDDQLYVHLMPATDQKAAAVFQQGVARGGRHQPRLRSAHARDRRPAAR